jgi:hypothetical protein
MEVLLSTDDIFGTTASQNRRKTIKISDVCKRANLQIKSPKFHSCIITLINCYEELEYESPFEIVSLIFKTSKAEYERVQQASLKAKNKNNAYPTQQRMPTNLNKITP